MYFAVRTEFLYTIQVDGRLTVLITSDTNCSLLLVTLHFIYFDIRNIKFCPHGVITCFVQFPTLYLQIRK